MAEVAEPATANHGELCVCVCVCVCSCACACTLAHLRHDEGDAKVVVHAAEGRHAETGGPVEQVAAVRLRLHSTVGAEEQVHTLGVRARVRECASASKRWCARAT